MRDIIKYNIPLIAQELLEGVVLVFLTNMIVGRMGAITLAIFNISQQLINIVLMPAYGYSSAINVLINDDNYNKRDVAKSVFKVGAAAYFLFALIVYANRYTILGFFGEDYLGYYYGINNYSGHKLHFCSFESDASEYGRSRVDSKNNFSD